MTCLMHCTSGSDSFNCPANCSTASSSMSNTTSPRNLRTLNRLVLSLSLALDRKVIIFIIITGLKVNVATKISNEFSDQPVRSSQETNVTNACKVTSKEISLKICHAQKEPYINSTSSVSASIPETGWATLFDFETSKKMGGV